MRSQDEECKGVESVSLLILSMIKEKPAHLHRHERLRWQVKNAKSKARRKVRRKEAGRLRLFMSWLKPRPTKHFVSGFLYRGRPALMYSEQDGTTH
jgi:hypothetical protein